MRIASFNANSIRSRTQIILDWLAQHQPDVLCVQETKVEDDKFPLKEFADAGWHCAIFGQKSYNGVAIITREPAQDIVAGLGRMPEDEEARIIRATVAGVHIVNTYVPQGTSLASPRFVYKLNWIRSLREYFQANFDPSDLVVWAGDFNVACEPLDVYDPEGLRGSLCYHPEEQAALDYVREWGFVDVFRKHHPGESNHYTFWDYRIPNGFKRRMGWRIDHIWAILPLAQLSTDCWIDIIPRSLEKPSDHTFIVADFEV